MVIDKPDILSLEIIPSEVVDSYSLNLDAEGNRRADTEQIPHTTYTNQQTMLAEQWWDYSTLLPCNSFFYIRSNKYYTTVY